MITATGLKGVQQTADRVWPSLFVILFKRIM